MIIEKTARRLGVKFFKEQGYPKLAKMVEDHLCIDGLFGVAVKLIRKKKLKQLYLELPKSLRTYFLFYLNGYNEFRLGQAIDRIWEEFPEIDTSGRPERRKDFQELMKEMNEILQRYFAR
ncbi:hypothetical protein ES703_73820 [subsurface metagenome]